MTTEARAELVRFAATLALIAAALGVLYALFVYGMRCDESCVGPRGASPPAGEPWDAYEGSWRWTAQLLVAACGLVVAVAARVVLRRRPRLAAVLFVLAAGVFLGWALFLPQGRFGIV